MDEGNYQQLAHEAYKEFTGRSVESDCQNAVPFWAIEGRREAIKKSDIDEWLVEALDMANNTSVSKRTGDRQLGGLYIKCNLTDQSCLYASKHRIHKILKGDNMGRKSLSMQEIDSESARNCIGYCLNKEAYRMALEQMEE